MLKKYFIQHTKQTESKPSSEDFMRFLLQREQLVGIFIWTLISFILFLYMHLSFETLFQSGDSYNYIGGAVTGFNPYRPMGYSWFLQFLALFSKTPSLVFYTQFILNYVASLFLILTLKFFIPYRHSISRLAFWMISILIVIGPSRNYLSNNVNSDSLFISLSLVWISTFFWIINKKSVYWVFVHLFLIFCTLFIRYTALFYPLISLLLIGIVFQGKLRSGLLLFILLPWLLLMIHWPKDTVLQKYTETYHAFSGWQSANNALHMMPYIELIPESFKDEELVKLHRIANLFPDSTCTKLGLTYDYIWHKDLPLKQNCFRLMEEQQISFYTAWPKNGKILKSYARAMTIRYPIEFFRFFLFPNFKKLFYNLNLETLGENNYLQIDNGWFTPINTNRKQPESDLFQKYVVNKIPLLNSLLWILMLILLGTSLYFSGLQQLSLNEKLIMWVLIIFVLVLVAFHTYASPIVFRFLLTIQPVHYILIYLGVISFEKLKPKGQM